MALPGGVHLFGAKDEAAAATLFNTVTAIMYFPVKQNSVMKFAVKKESDMYFSPKLEKEVLF